MINLRLIQRKKRRLFRLLRMQGPPRRFPSGPLTVRMVVNIGTRLITIYAVTEGPTRDEYSRPITRKSGLGPASCWDTRNGGPISLHFAGSSLGVAHLWYGIFRGMGTATLCKDLGRREVGGHWPHRLRHYTCQAHDILGTIFTRIHRNNPFLIRSASEVPYL